MPNNARDNLLPIANCSHNALDSLGYHLWMLDHVALGVDNARDQHHIGGQLVFADRRSLVLLSRIAKFQAKCAYFRFV